MLRLLPLLMLTCCDRKPVDSAPPPPQDEDGDGHPPYDAGGDDCDDADPGVYAGAEEHCDGLDEDCDLRVDEDPVDPVDAWWDADGDGWGAGDPEPVCAPGEGQAPAGGDCDDGDDGVSPGAPEVGFNGVDDDCDPSTDDVCGENPPALVVFDLEAVEEHEFGGRPYPAVAVYAEFDDPDGDLDGGSALRLWWGRVDAGGADVGGAPSYTSGGGDVTSGCGAQTSRSSLFFQVGEGLFDYEAEYEVAAQMVDKGGASSEVASARVTTTASLE